ncbi:EF-hand domain-containing protein [Paucidesulfovibrio longus]|uniref:EF-hand domain-containing protein n=1 Tax=Paucidesulfovibrio longus TaxID=889 RepID=UPI0003B4EE4C|nr:EF-hand domain-containing protein [Paucidesulfovibrio longus]
MRIGKRVGAAMLPLILATGLFLLAPAALAGQGGPEGPGGHGPGFGPGIAVEKIDADSDGRISQDEISAYAARQATEIDTDKNGKVSIKELRDLEERRREAMLEKRYRAMDKNNDGVVSVEEYEQALKARFEFVPAGRGGPGDMPPRQ